MLIIPAIDLKGGEVVRLYQGKFNKQKTYSADPVAIARMWQEQGAKYLHIVDLDAAASGKLVHLNILKKIIKGVKIPLEFGGGIRQEKNIRQVLNCGVERVVLGSKLKEEGFLQRVIRKFKQKIIVSVDARNDRVCIDGWKRLCPHLTLLGAIRRLKDLGLRQVIYTDISRDGTLKGPNLRAIKGILNNCEVSLIASGGISSLQDLYKLRNLQLPRLSGVIIGKALYEGRFSLRQANKIGGEYAK